MKRFHLHVAVDNLATSIRFYAGLFGAQPTVAKADYAKWMLDDPRINFAISSRGAKPGLDHLGLQVDSATELTALRDQFAQAELAAVNEGESVCCYAKSEKSWLRDPSGIAWEAYRTMEEASLFGGPEADGHHAAGSDAAGSDAALPATGSSLLPMSQSCCSSHSRGTCCE